MVFFIIVCVRWSYLSVVMWARQACARVCMRVWCCRHGAGGPGALAADDTTFLKPSWHITAKLLTTMSAPSFLRQLVELPMSSINDETVELLRPYLVRWASSAPAS